MIAIEEDKVDLDLLLDTITGPVYDNVTLLQQLQLLKQTRSKARHPRFGLEARLEEVYCFFVSHSLFVGPAGEIQIVRRVEWQCSVTYGGAIIDKRSRAQRDKNDEKSPRSSRRPGTTTEQKRRNLPETRPVVPLRMVDALSLGANVAP